jgi:hypothetical protein
MQSTGSIVSTALQPTFHTLPLYCRQYLRRYSSTTCEPGSIVSIASDYGLDDWGSIPGKCKGFSSSLCVQLVPGILLPGLKHGYLRTSPNSVTTQITNVNIFITMRTSNHIQLHSLEQTKTRHTPISVVLYLSHSTFEMPSILT